MTVPMIDITPPQPPRQRPSVGRIVHYKLSAGDVAIIDRDTPRVVDGRTVRNDVRAGQVLPATVTAVFGTGSTANLIVQLDGAGQYWATSRSESDNEGAWSWPPRVGA